MESELEFDLQKTTMDQLICKLVYNVIWCLARSHALATFPLKRLGNTVRDLHSVQCNEPKMSNKTNIMYCILETEKQKLMNAIPSRLLLKHINERKKKILYILYKGAT